MGVRKLVVLDLTCADVELFESYERRVLPLLGKHQGKLELSIRAVDSSTETHVLYFQDANCFDSFLADPGRIELKDMWLRTGVTSTISDVEPVSYF